MGLSNIFHLGIKEFRGLRRDPVLLALILFSFTVSIYVASTAVPETLNRAQIAIVDEDRSPLSTRILAAFEPPYFTTPEIITAAEMDRRMDQGIDTFALDIPPEFQRDVLAGRAPAIQLNVDATRMTQAFAGSGYVQSIVTGEVDAFLARRRSAEALPVELTLRARFNPELNKSWFGSIMELIENITMLSIILTGAALIREREHGTVEHLLVMPVTPFQIMASKIWSMSAVVLTASTLSLFLIIRGSLGVPIEGSIPLFLAGAALHLFATSCLGIFLGTLAGSMPQFGLLMILVLIPLHILSGATTPRESMPEFIRTLMLVAPNTHFVQIAQGILYRSAGLDVVWPYFASLLAIGAVLFAFSLRRFRASLR